jgi:hypothetical protein
LISSSSKLLNKICKRQFSNRSKQIPKGRLDNFFAGSGDFLLGC